MLIEEQGDREIIRGYYGDLQNCIGGFIEKKIRLSNASSMFGLMNYIKSLQTGLSRALQPLKLRVVNEILKEEKDEKIE